MTVDHGVVGWWWRVAATPRVAAGLAAAALILAWLGAGLAITNARGWQELFTHFATYAGPSSATTAAAWVGSWVWFLVFLPFALILLVFPDGRLRWPWTRRLAWVWCGFTAVGVLSLALSDTTFTDGIPDWYHNPVAVPGAAGVYSVVQAEFKRHSLAREWR